ncbi:conserved unknown protein [Ectocarpus siliculosus]|uniref:Phosphoglycerate mutase n=1 Tax=Ectocarpus siliculosus TaxID=2880 RepID=D7FLW5_ECTSI|nr:conserved unknown protein [Ectocarpus siliculosus]|eukprot:CBJ29761.1 conserved unknown protein [Ectocarpus siliculosus]
MGLLLHQVTGWTTFRSSVHVRAQQSVGSVDSTTTTTATTTTTTTTRIPSSSRGWTPATNSALFPNRRRRAAATAVVLSAASSSTISNEGYKVEESGRCTGLEALPPLKNRYYALRHGQSVANMEGIISSNPKVGSVKHGLTSNGRSQARVAATALIEAVGRDRLDSLVFVSSEFLRARQTAEECRAALQNILSFERAAMAMGGGKGDDAAADGTGAEGGDGEFSLDEGSMGGYDVSPPLVIRQELRERAFGELDGTILVNYNKVWPEDLKDGMQEGYGVESVCDVASRVGRLVRALERDYEDADIVLSSHADTLQIAQCYIAGADERLFSQYRFKNGEVRRLLRDPDSLPPPAPLSFQ